MTTPRLVLVEWVDSYGCSADWQKIVDLKPMPLLVRSVGWLLHDGDECKVVVPHLSVDGHPQADQQGMGDVTIPTVAIRSISDLTPEGHAR